MASASVGRRVRAPRSALQFVGSMSQKCVRIIDRSSVDCGSAARLPERDSASQSSIRALSSPRQLPFPCQDLIASLNLLPLLFLFAARHFRCIWMLTSLVTRHGSLLVRRIREQAELDSHSISSISAASERGALLSSRRVTPREANKPLSPTTSTHHIQSATCLNCLYSNVVLFIYCLIGD